MQVTYVAPRGQETPPPGTRPEQLPAAPGPQLAAATVGFVAAGAPSLAVVLVSDDRIDDAALQVLLQQFLLARAEEEEKAREVAVVKELEEDLVLREQRLLRQVDELRGAGTEAQAECSRPELAAIRWCMVKAKILKRRRRGKRRRGSRVPAHLLFMASHDSLFPWFDTGNMLMRQSFAPEVVPSCSPVVLAAPVGAFGSGMCLLVLLRHIVWWYSTGRRIWQSLVPCSPVEYRIMDFSVRILPDMPYSALLGSTVDA